MSNYHDQYFDAADVSVFLTLLADEINVLGPTHGVPAYLPPEGSVDESGQPLVARPALGDPARVYISVRSETLIPVPEGAVETAPDLAQAILGVWA